MTDRHVTTDDTTKNDGTFNTPETVHPENRETAQRQYQHRELTDSEKYGILVHPEDMAFLINEVEGTIQVMDAFKNDSESWQEIVEAQLDDEFEKDYAKLQYILATYGTQQED